MKIAFLTIGLNEKSDSVGFDCVYQYKALRNSVQHPDDITLFADAFDPACHPGLVVGDADAFSRWCAENPDHVVIFHYCDSRSKFDAVVRQRRAPVVIRWHNNTPPWFNFGLQNQNAIQSLVGFENLLEFIATPQIRFWVNSDFTRGQLLALGCAASRCSTVFPASRYLEPADAIPASGRAARGGSGALDILFVGRVVTHKGHLAAIATAARVQAATSEAVTLHFAGRQDAGLGRFNRDLRSRAADSGVAVVFHGEVTEGELAELYGRADVFLCLSEHEGFGLPVFEAMRCEVPVVAWATTALGELLADHPLAFPLHDIDLFAAAILALRDPAVQARVLTAQQTVLARYTAAIVARQLSDAVAAVSGGKPASPLDQASPALLADPELAAALDGWLLEANGRFAQRDADLLNDSGRNLVSLYDIAQYRGFFEGQRRMRFAALEQQRADPVVVFEPSEFSSRHGSVEDDVLHVPVAAYGTEHLLYGPYAEFPTGSYVAELDLSITLPGPPAAFELDVNAQDIGILDRLIVDPAKLRPGAPIAIPFRVASEHALVEFRLRAMADFTGGLALRGVTVRMLGMQAPAALDLVGDPPRSFLSQAFSLIARTAQSHFRQADRHRDAGRWSEAAEQYGKGLAIDPHRFHFIVQRGHALKEAGRLFEAEEAYLRALKLRPDNRDLNLNIGHLYKLMHRPGEAEAFYFRALSQDGVALAAAEELWQLGSSVAALRKRMAPV